MRGARYWITTTDRNTWEECNATTLRGAKCCAVREYGAGYVGSILRIGVWDGVRIVSIANKSNTPGARWQDADGGL